MTQSHKKASNQPQLQSTSQQPLSFPVQFVTVCAGTNVDTDWSVTHLNRFYTPHNCVHVRIPDKCLDAADSELTEGYYSGRPAIAEPLQGPSHRAAVHAACTDKAGAIGRACCRIRSACDQISPTHGQITA